MNPKQSIAVTPRDLLPSMRLKKDKSATSVLIDTTTTNNSAQVKKTTTGKEFYEKIK